MLKGCGYVGLFVLGYWIGGSQECSCVLAWYNPLQYYQTLTALRASPWSWVSPETAMLLRDAQHEWGGLMGAAVLTPIAWKLGGPAAAMQLWTLMSSRSRSAGMVADRVRAHRRSYEEEPEWIESRYVRPKRNMAPARPAIPWRWPAIRGRTEPAVSAGGSRTAIVAA